MPVTEKALSPRTLWLGRMAGFGALYGGPFTRRQLVHKRTMFLTCWRMDVIQYLWRMLQIVEETPQWKPRSWWCRMMRRAISVFFGRRMGFRASIGKSASCNRPRQRISESWSRKRSNWETNAGRRPFWSPRRYSNSSDRKWYWEEAIQRISARLSSFEVKNPWIHCLFLCWKLWSWQRKQAVVLISEVQLKRRMSITFEISFVRGILSGAAIVEISARWRALAWLRLETFHWGQSFSDVNQVGPLIQMGDVLSWCKVNPLVTRSAGFEAVGQ